MVSREKRALAGLAMSNLIYVTFEDAEGSRRAEATYNKLNDGHKACLKADPFYEEKFVPAFLCLKCWGILATPPLVEQQYLYSKPGAYSRRAMDDTISPTSVFPSTSLSLSPCSSSQHFLVIYCLDEILNLKDQIDYFKSRRYYTAIRWKIVIPMHPRSVQRMYSSPHHESSFNHKSRFNLKSLFNLESRFNHAMQNALLSTHAYNI